jgi:hypothetical protein
MHHSLLFANMEHRIAILRTGYVLQLTQRIDSTIEHTLLDRRY